MVEAPRDNWAAQAEAELNEFFAVDRGPLVRCVLVRHGPDESTVLLSFHHSIGDAMSGAYLLRDLFKSAAQAVQGLDPALPALEPKKAMNDYFPAWATGLSGRWRNIMYAAWVLASVPRWGLPVAPPFDQSARPRDLRPRLAVRRLDPDFVARLHLRAGQEQTTLHGALLAAQILAIAQDRADRKKRFYLLGSPVNLRKRLDPPVLDDVGFFVTMGASTVPAGPDDDFWTLAKALRSSLWDCVERGYPFVYVYQHLDLSRITGLLGLTSAGAWLHNRVSALAAMGGLSLSNIGVVDIETHQGPFTIESLGFAASGAGLSPLIGFAATVERESTYNLVGMEPLISRDHTERLADMVLQNLLSSV